MHHYISLLLAILSLMMTLQKVLQMANLSFLVSRSKEYDKYGRGHNEVPSMGGEPERGGRAEIFSCF